MALALAQNVGGQATSGQTSFTSTAASFTAGNLLLALVTWSCSSPAPTGISTPTGWTQLAFIANGAPNGASAIYSMPNNPGGSQSWTWSLTGGGAAGGWAYTILEWSGAPTSSVLDLAVTSSATGTTSSTSHDPGAASGTTKAGDAIIGFFGSNRSTPPTYTIASTSNPTGGWTLTTPYNSTGGSPNSGVVAAYQVVSGAVTNPDCIGTSSTVTSGEAFLVTILAAGGGTTLSSGVVNVGGAGDVFLAGSVVAVIAGATSLGSFNPNGLAAPDLPLGGRNSSGLAPPDLPLGGGGGGGLQATAILVVRSGVLSLGGSGDVHAPDLSLGGGGGLAVPDLAVGGGGGGLLATGTTVVLSGVLSLGGSGALVLAPGPTSIVPSGVVALGSQGDGLAPFAGIVFDTATQFSVGDNSGSGLSVLGSQVTLSSGPVMLGGTGGLVGTGTSIIRGTVAQLGNAGGGLAGVLGFSGYPGGHWVSCVVWVWRQHSPGVYGWTLVKCHIWRSGAWVNL